MRYKEDGKKPGGRPENGLVRSLHCTGKRQYAAVHNKWAELEGLLALKAQQAPKERKGAQGSTAGLPLPITAAARGRGTSLAAWVGCRQACAAAAQGCCRLSNSRRVGHRRRGRGGRCLGMAATNAEGREGPGTLWLSKGGSSLCSGSQLRRSDGRAGDTWLRRRGLSSLASNGLATAGGWRLALQHSVWPNQLWRAASCHRTFCQPGRHAAAIILSSQLWLCRQQRHVCQPLCRGACPKADRRRLPSWL